MEKLIINEEYRDQQMGHGTISKKLKDYTQEELVELAIQASLSGNQILIRCFKGSIPNIDELRISKVDNEETLISENTPPPLPKSK